MKLISNQINPAKLLLSKWTSAIPQMKEKHFLVTDIIRDVDNNITGCVLEAVLTNRQYEIDWKVLQNKSQWLVGWL